MNDVSSINDVSFFPDEALTFETVEAGKVGRKIRARGGKLMIVEVFFKAGAVGYEHSHPHEQICYCLEGEFEFMLDGRLIPLKAGDSIYVPPSVPHGANCIAEGRLLDIFTPQREDFLANH